jgi:hypothetical protein
MSLAILLLGNIHRSSWDPENALDRRNVTLLISALVTSVVAVATTSMA